tara:strand:- start:312 stop:815 length:504 start_codon:yes stop_codon:yes gene_type:complete
MKKIILLLIIIFFSCKDYGNPLGPVDCAGIVNGDALEDNCGICDNDSSNDCPVDCNGDFGGDAVEDECGVCNGDNSTCLDNYSDIQLIFDVNCIGCHYNGSDLISYQSYEDVISGGSVGNDLISSSLYDRITREESESGDMPPSGSLTTQQIELIASWINAGGLLEW